jgi:HlyD family secretion protein
MYSVARKTEGLGVESIFLGDFMDTKINSTTAVPLPVPGRLTKPIGFIRSHSKLLGAVLLLLLGGALAFVWWSKRSTNGDYLTDKVSRGSIEVDVSATGTVQAVTTVQVGSQVSGSVAWLGADFKSRVSQGQVIAKLDPALFQAQVDTARANVMNAQAGVQAAMTDIQNQNANIEAAKANDRANAAARDDAISIAKQNEKLRGIIPDREIEAAQNAAKQAVARYSQATSQIGQAQAQLQIAQAKLKQAQAAVSQSQAQLQQATVNLDHSIITSPIDGVVVSRSVDVGQTVAASLSAPTLFTIANDLTNMQVLASIDEADVGQVREGGKAHFTVDAFPGQTFNGDLTQVRLNAQTLQNVVTYTAVISVANPELKLMPGMTANITIPVSRRDDVLRVPNSALRFKPELTDQQQKDLQAKIDEFRKQQQSQAGNDADQQKTPAAPAEGSTPPNNAGEAKPEGRGQWRKNRNGDSSGQSGQDRGGNRGAAGDKSKDQAAGATPAEGQRRRHQPAATDEKTAADQSAAGSANSDPGATHRRRGEGANAGESRKPQGAADGSKAEGKGESRGEHRRDRGGNDGKADNSKTAPAASPSPSASGAQAQSGGGRRGGGPRQIVAIWVLSANKTLEARIVRIGITDGRFTEIIAGDLKEGDVIVTGQNDANANSNRAPQPTTPFQQRPPGAGGGGRGR